MSADLAAAESGRLLHLVRDEPRASATGDNPAQARRRDLVGAEIGATWQCELVPIPQNVADDPSIRLVVAMVVSGEYVVANETIAHPPPEIAELAAALADAVRKGMAAAQSKPAVVHVRHGRMADALGPLLAPDGIRVSAVRRMNFLDEAADSLIAFDPDPAGRSRGSGGAPTQLRVSRPDTWKAWQLPSEQIARLFSAAAAYNRAGPWKVVSNSHAFTVRVPEGNSWTVSLMGNAGMEFGIVLYEHRNDLVQVLTSYNHRATFRKFEGAVISLSFEKERDLPSAMVKEVRRAGWEVVSAKAWPSLSPYNSIAGGISARTMEDLIALLPAVSRFVSAHARIMLGYERISLPLRWDDSESGVEIQFDGVVGEDGSDAARPAELAIPRPAWQPQDPTMAMLLSPCGASGPGALPLMMFDPNTPWEEHLARAGEIVVELERFLAAGGAGKTAARAAKKHSMIIELFVVHFLAGAHQTPLPAITEYDLRVFLYDWFLRKAMMTERESVSGLTSLRYFFEFIAAAKGIECDWAAPILRDRDAFVDRMLSKPEGMFLDEAVMDWQAELNQDLDARVFIPDQGDAGGIEWGHMMGLTEAGLAHLLERLWLKWRDEVIAQGVRNPEHVRAALISRQHEFEQTAVPGTPGTPADLIAAERKKSLAQQGSRRSSPRDVKSD